MLAAGAAAVVAGVWAADALVVTERERVEDFVAAVTGRVTVERVDAALRYVDPARQSVELTVFDETETYAQDDAAALRARARSALQRYEGQTFRVLRRDIDVRPAVATVALQVLSEQGLRAVDFTLHRHGDAWLVGRVRVR